MKKVMVKLEDVFEDVVAAAAAAPASGAGEIASAPTNNNDTDIVDGSNGKGTTANDVLGKDCDHEKNGYLSAGCFHMPLVATAKGKKANNKRRKKKKNPYENGMAVIVDADDVPNNIIDSIKKLKSDDIKKLLKTSFQTDIDDNQLDCIVYCPLDGKLILKFVDEDGKNAYVHLEEKDGKIVAQDLRLYNSLELERAYKSLKKPGTANQKIGVKDIQLNVVWRRK